MKRIRIVVASACLLVLGVFVLPHLSWGDVVTLQVYVNGVPPPPPPPPSPPPSGGGGGGGGNEPTAYAPDSGQITFQGIAYPRSIVTFMRDGQYLGQVQAGPDATFEFVSNNVTPGTYTYGVWSADAQKIRSVAHTFTTAVLPSVGTIVSGIFLSPTLSVDKSMVRQGDALMLQGQTVPNGIVTLRIDSTGELVRTVAARNDGRYAYSLNTLNLSYGSYTVNARTKTADAASEQSQNFLFAVGDHTVFAAPQPSGGTAADLNGDGKMNLIDLSILSYWYKRPLTAEGLKADLNGDGKVDLKDFSILAYYWTG